MPRAVCFHWVYACGSLRVSCLCGNPSPAFTVFFLSSWSCAWLPHLPLASDWAGAFYPGGSHQVFIILWKILEADSILNSSLSLWPWLALGSRKIIEQNGLVCYCASSYIDSGPKASSGARRGAGRADRFPLLTPALGLCSFLRDHLTDPGPPLTSGAQHSSWSKSSSEIKFLEWQCRPAGATQCVEWPRQWLPLCSLNQISLFLPQAQALAICLRPRTHLPPDLCTTVFFPFSAQVSLLRVAPLTAA